MTRLWKLLFGLIRPICPHCDGKGGFMSGYYEPEFSGCSCCNPDEDVEGDPTRVWRWRVWMHQFEMWRERRYWGKLFDAEMRRENEETTP